MPEKIIQLNEGIIKNELKELVRSSVEETLNGLLEAEANQLTNAAKYERSEERQGYRSGHYSRNLTTTSGDVTLNVPKLKGVSFETAIIERYRRRESSVEEALIEMYLAGVSVRRVEDITEALWGTKVSPATISELNKKAYVHIEEWRNRPLQGGKYPYVYVDGIYLRRNWGGEFENVSILVAIAVNEDAPFHGALRPVADAVLVGENSGARRGRCVKPEHLRVAVVKTTAPAQKEVPSLPADPFVLRSRKEKKGVPTTAVRIPMGSSEEMRFRAAISTITRKAAPLAVCFAALFS